MHPVTETELTPRPLLEDVIRTVYSNLVHSFDDEAVELLKRGALPCAAHTAWDFHGTIWFEDGVWKEQVWTRRYPSAQYESKHLPSLVEHVLERHGRA